MATESSGIKIARLETKMQRRIILAAGHGGGDSGAVGQGTHSPTLIRAINAYV